MSKPTVNPTTGVITFPTDMVFNRVETFIRDTTRSMAEMKDYAPTVFMVIGTNGILPLNIVPTNANPNYTNQELKDAHTNPTYTYSNYNRKEYVQNNTKMFLMLQQGWNDDKIYDSQQNIMISIGLSSI